MRLLIAFLAVGLIFLAIKRLVFQLLRKQGLERTNYRGEVVVTAGGLLLLIPAIPPSLLLSNNFREQIWYTAGLLGFALLGLLDDCYGDRSVGGFTGHFKLLLSQGRVSTGVIKAIGGGLLSLTLSSALHQGVSILPYALVIALFANAFNLVDTRPVRALALYWLGLLGAEITSWLIHLPSAPLALRSLGLATLLYLPLERRRQVMLGDTGANLLGAGIGLWCASRLGGVEVSFVLLLLILFHLYTERFSLNRAIEQIPWLRAVDHWLRGETFSGKSLLLFSLRREKE